LKRLTTRGGGGVQAGSGGTISANIAGSSLRGQRRTKKG